MTKHQRYETNRLETERPRRLARPRERAEHENASPGAVRKQQKAANNQVRFNTTSNVAISLAVLIFCCALTKARSELASTAVNKESSTIATFQATCGSVRECSILQNLVPGKNRKPQKSKRHNAERDRHLEQQTGKENLCLQTGVVHGCEPSYR